MSLAPHLLYPLCKHVLLGPALRRRLDLVVIGADKAPARGPLIVAANHLAEIDSLVLALAIRRRLSFFAKAEYFTAPGARGLASRAFFVGTGQIPVDRSGDTAALNAARRTLARGDAWAIYPEGTRSPDGRLHRGHTGAMRVAARVPGVQVVPVALHGTAAVKPHGSRRLVLPGRVSVRIGDPVDASTILGPDLDVRTGTDRLMTAIRDLGDLDYVDEYARR